MRLLILFMLCSFSLWSQRKTNFPKQFDQLVLTGEPKTQKFPFNDSAFIKLKLVNTSDKKITNILSPEAGKDYNNKREITFFKVDKEVLNPNDTLTINVSLLPPIDFSNRLFFNLFFKVNGERRRKFVEYKFDVEDPVVSIEFIGDSNFNSISVDSTKTISFYVEVPNSKSIEMNLRTYDYIKINGFENDCPNDDYWLEKTYKFVAQNKYLVSYKVKNIFGNSGNFKLKIEVNSFLSKPYVSMKPFKLSFKGSFDGNKNDTSFILRKGNSCNEFKYREGKLQSWEYADIERAFDLFGGAIMKFDSLIVNYGVIKQGANGERVFTFKNIGNEPLIIKHAKSSCGCLVASWPRDPILPGETSEIKAKYDTKRLGPINKSITVASNSINQPYIVLRIKGRVVE